MKRILVFGGRDYTDEAAIFRALDRLHATRGIACVIHGDCHVTEINADKLAGKWARSRGVEEKPYRIEQERDGPWPGCGPVRNIRMFTDSNPDAGVGFPGDKGTRHMASVLRKAGKPIWWPEGGDPLEVKR